MFLGRPKGDNLRRLLYMKCLLQITLILVAVFTGSVAGATELKLGHIDLQKIVARSDAGKEAHQSYIERAKKFQEDISTRSDQLKKLKESLDLSAKSIKADEKVPQNIVDMDKEYGAQARELQRLLGIYQDDLKVYDSELTRKVLEKFFPILEEFAKKNNYDYIFRGFDALAYANKKLDLTDELVKEYNKKRKK
jgi:outer membrane protein